MKLAARISPAEAINEPPVCLQIIDNGIRANVCTLGNFSLATGKAKSRKSFFTALTFSVVTGYYNDHFYGCLPEGRSKGIYFDTEQSKYHVQKLLHRICRLTNQDDPPNIEVYSLRKYTPQERMLLIEHIISEDPHIGFVVIDGIRDLATSINDEEQATMVSTKLLKWTEEYNMHIMAVLHQNKGDNNARGHLGSELTNKAETVLSISKNEADKDISVVEATYCRDREFNPFAFIIDVEGLPAVMDSWADTRGAGRAHRNIIEELGDENIYNMLKECFANDSRMKYRSVQNQIKIAGSKLFHKNISDGKAVQIITYCKNKLWIVQENSMAPYTLDTFNSTI